MDENIVYKKKGELGMFVTEGAAEKLRQKTGRKASMKNFIKAMVEEAKRLEISRKS